ncbi:TetR/AcrR family transcriptional regulator [Herbidospora mongoliensis]|uniref:TetR/AcrR family transcriptional regulator n=1 Tax=Herbidospora mongoliensis TaxID=688067 RepID=UPI00082A44D0|nr:TetR/AcrR family transcriptional regulator [Herbidospora mongoliensis]
MSERTSTESAFAPRETRDTRERIQEIALELFTEQGYEATSLREIAEALGVTKAALYYHFKTKEDIVAGMVVDRISSLDAIIMELRAHETVTPEMRREAIVHYAKGAYEGRAITRFMERNPTAMKHHPVIMQMREKVLELSGLLVSHDDTLTVRLKRGLALFAIHAVGFMLPGPEIDEDERYETSLKVALELIEANEG